MRPAAARSASRTRMVITAATRPTASSSRNHGGYRHYMSLLCLVTLSSILLFVACYRSGTGVAVIRMSVPNETTQQLTRRIGEGGGRVAQRSVSSLQPRQVEDDAVAGVQARSWNEAGEAKSSRQMLADWWMSHPDAPLGLSCDPSSRRTTAAFDNNSGSSNSISNNDARSEKATYMGLSVPPPLFQPRTPARPLPDTERVDVAMVVTFVPFQLNKVVDLISTHWAKHPPCNADTPSQSVDLIFFTESRASDAVRDTLKYYIAELGGTNSNRSGNATATSCFNSPEPIFLSLNDGDAEPKLSHLEGAAYSFFSLFELLESKYRSFFLAEPDVAPVQSDWARALVEHSRKVGCDDGAWQLGSIPLVADVEAGMLRDRVDYHINGNALYVLGCQGFEDYKCRMQTHFVPKDECSNVAGCGTHEAYEGGYDHALYRYRMHPDNYEYSRLVMHRFFYSSFIQNRGEALYRSEVAVKEEPSTYFIHSKSIYNDPAATVLKEVIVSALRRDICIEEKDDDAARKELQSIYNQLRIRNYDKTDALRHMCGAAEDGKFGSIKPVQNICGGYIPQTEGGMEEGHAKRRENFIIAVVGGQLDLIECEVSAVAAAGGIIRVLNDGADLDAVDAVLCMSLETCKSALANGHRPVIVYASALLRELPRQDGGNNRLRQGDNDAHSRENLMEWLKNIKGGSEAMQPAAAVLVYSILDQEYILYNCGLNTRLLERRCGYNDDVKLCDTGWDSLLPAFRSPSRNDIIIVTPLLNTSLADSIVIDALKHSPNGLHLTCTHKIHAQYDARNVLCHHAVVLIPTLSIATREIDGFNKLYRMNVPIFCPSLRLFEKWHDTYELNVHVGSDSSSKALEAAENISLSNDGGPPSPQILTHQSRSTDAWENAFNQWAPKLDVYRHDHVTYFDSWDHFFQLYAEMKGNGSLDAISRSMLKANSIHRTDIIDAWKVALKRLLEGSVI